MSLVREFREFAIKGNVVDLAVAVIIGTAFGKIVTSLVADLIMPIVGAMVGGIHYENLYIQVGEAKIMYGRFIENVVDFFIIALVIFFLVRLINHLRRQDAAKPPPREEQLLEEIRDLLKQKR
jgi:large conductance mechanosensitive channel